MNKIQSLAEIAAEFREAKRRVTYYPVHAYRIADVAWKRLKRLPQTQLESLLVERTGHNLAAAFRLAEAYRDGLRGALDLAIVEVEAWAGRIEDESRGGGRS
jgi:predicted ATPase